VYYFQNKFCLGLDKTLKYCLRGSPGRPISKYYAITGIVRPIRTSKVFVWVSQAHQA